MTASNLEISLNQNPNFRSQDFLLNHIRCTMNFYHPNCIDARGGFYHYFKDDGSKYKTESRHLVSSTRFIFNYAMAFCRFGNPEYLDAVKHGVKFLREKHRNPTTGGYAWTLLNGEPDDVTNHCYGLAFVVLAYAKALEAGVSESKDHLDETWHLMEQRFWQPEFGLYADEANTNWTLSPYRGQNANMHSCEAFLAAFEASGDKRYLDRAAVLADNMVNRQAAKADRLIWEHYDTSWNPDWEYNKGIRSNIFRPWGFQPGHQVEWAKLLLILDRHQPATWHLQRAKELFDRSMSLSWDRQNGGLVYGFDRDGRFYDEDKYFWVQAEALAAAALLADRTGQNEYWQWYERLWDYSWKHFIDHQYGAWFRILKPDNRKYDDEKSPAGKTDYHTMGACYEVLNIIK